MRKLLLIKKQKEWDKELEKEKVTLPIEEFYKKLDYKDKEIILNNKEIYFKNCKERFYPYDKICFDLYADLSFIQFRIESLKKEQEKKMK